MANQIETYVITGKAHYARLFKPMPNYGKDGLEWKIDVEVDAEAKKTLKGLGLASKVKNKGDERGDFISFKRATVKKSGPQKGQDNKPITVVGPDGKTAWDSNSLLGNGTVVRVKFVANDTKDQHGKPARRADIFAVQVVNLVPYTAPERSEFDAVEGAEQGDAPAKDW